MWTGPIEAKGLSLSFSRSTKGLLVVAGLPPMAMEGKYTTASVYLVYAAACPKTGGSVNRLPQSHNTWSVLFVQRWKKGGRRRREGSVPSERYLGNASGLEGGRGAYWKRKIQPARAGQRLSCPRLRRGYAGSIMACSRVPVRTKRDFVREVKAEDEGARQRRS